jgi:hypothetical protein
MEARIDAGGDQDEVIEDEQCVEAGGRVEAQSRHAEVLVDDQEQEPETHDEAFLGQEGQVAHAEHPGHDRISLAAPALHPEHGEECVEDVEHEDEDEQKHVSAREDVDVDVPLLAGAPAAPAAPLAHEGGEGRRRLLAPIGVAAAIEVGPVARIDARRR